MVDRRSFITGSAALAGGAALLPATARSTDTPGADRADVSGMTARETNGLLGPLAHRERAAMVMAEQGLDAIIAGDPTHVFYLTGRWPLFTRMQQPYPCYALLPAGENSTIFGIFHSSESWQPGYQGDDLALQLYTGPAGDAISGQFDRPPPARQLGGFWPVGEELTPHEKRILETRETYLPQAAANPEWGIVTALRDAGIRGGRIGVDRMGIATALQALGLEGFEFVPAENALRRIRLVKTAREIAMLREASAANAAAARGMARQFVPGMTMAEVEQAFRMEAARVGNEAVFVIAGNPGHFPDEEVVAGKPVIIDCVSHRNRYHGDFGRTVIYGEPAKLLQQRVEALGQIWDDVFAALRPGLRYSEIRPIAQAALAKTSVPNQQLVANPHSVGLQHTDEPWKEGIDHVAKDDIVLQAGMTLTVDIPFIEYGWGGCHLEDMVVITETGADWLNDKEERLIIV